jgi:5-methyltetrahydropteroyltriglutamate--homocysteine methyltransferase
MIKVHNLGFPRIGMRRELKHSLESYWSGRSSEEQLEEEARRLRAADWAAQASRGVDAVPVGDSSLYDHVLDISVMIGAIPDHLDAYFSHARGGVVDGHTVAPAEMTKWFDTNYHYIVPRPPERFAPQPGRILTAIREAQALGHQPKPVLVGPVTYLSLIRTGTIDPHDLLSPLLEVYAAVIQEIAATGVEWIELDEPILATDCREWTGDFQHAYSRLTGAGAKILMASYFGPLRENLKLVAELPVDGLHVDAVRAPEELEPAAQLFAREDRVLSAGVVDGRNVWRTDLDHALDQLESIRDRLGDRLWIAPSCSLLHVPIDLDREDPHLVIRPWMAFALQKLDELKVLARGLTNGRTEVAAELEECRSVLGTRRASSLSCDETIRARTRSITDRMMVRTKPYRQRAAIQQARFGLSPLPTTTIGSFPQTRAIRRTRRAYRTGQVTAAEYKRLMEEEIRRIVRKQEEIGLDVLVHGEPERTDMVEYFGELLDGIAITSEGWVQSYGSRCVKPPVIYGDVARRRPMTVRWTRFAQSLTDQPVKGMLTGPITMLSWSFVRDDQPEEETALQLALAIRDEVTDLERAGVGMIQVDEPAFREHLPLRRADRAGYLEWAGRSFRVATSAVTDQTQIHTHMCYADFDEIIESIAALDADVITMEAARSGMDLLKVLDNFVYPNEIGPGLYDIHSPRVPSIDEIVRRIRDALVRIPIERLWVNPDCGLKTRSWPETEEALENMVAAARVVRTGYAGDVRHRLVGSRM